MSSPALSPACNYASVALEQEEITCSRNVPDAVLKNGCWCSALDPESLYSYCSVADDRKLWSSFYQDAVALRLKACDFVNKTVPSNDPLLVLPTSIPNPLIASSSTTTTTTVPAAASTPTPAPFADGSTCSTGVGYPTSDKAIQMDFTNKNVTTAATCNAACLADTTPGINYSGIVQSGPFINCFCLIGFNVTNADGACVSCVTYPNYPGYPASNFANCGMGNPSTGSVSFIAIVPVNGGGAASSSVTSLLSSTTAFTTSAESTAPETSTAAVSWTATDSFAVTTSAISTFSHNTVTGAIGSGVLEVDTRVKASLYTSQSHLLTSFLHQLKEFMNRFRISNRYFVAPSPVHTPTTTATTYHQAYEATAVETTDNDVAETTPVYFETITTAYETTAMEYVAPSPVPVYEATNTTAATNQVYATTSVPVVYTPFPTTLLCLFQPRHTQFMVPQHLLPYMFQPRCTAQQLPPFTPQPQRTAL
ncbi:UNVERIFIED_CONTAM: hypothetical protein HDU68_000721 [Siphonaria sp. JEL0065]|nr:hypothetical protein HDU68_000721 [Siphonaria sp. JEL0065]